MISLTISVGWLVPAALCMLVIGVGLYERGQRKGVEAAERVFKPLIDMLEERLETERATSCGNCGVDLIVSSNRKGEKQDGI